MLIPEIVKNEFVECDELFLISLCKMTTQKIQNQTNRHLIFNL